SPQARVVPPTNRRPIANGAAERAGSRRSPPTPSSRRVLTVSTTGERAARTQASRVLLQDSVPSNGLGGSVEVRPPMSNGIELRLGADARRTSGATHELFTFVNGDPTRRRVAGGETMTSGAFAELTAPLGKGTLSGGARIDHWSIT